jgi:sterol desaturase/sphingolipid hydroxylase (fatty acid hydroxylase superfamily)
MSKFSEMVSNLVMMLMFCFIAIILAACLAYPIKWMWNYGLSPTVEGINDISAIQALLIFLLIKVFFTSIDKKTFE